MIKFYSTRGEYGCFSNFSKHSFIVDGRIWMTSEHYYQAQKHIENKEYYDKIHMALGPMDAAKLGRNSSNTFRKDWDEVKLNVMKEVILLKFLSNTSAQKVLLSTGEKELIEASLTDNYWGEGKDGKGENNLGKILMSVRKILKNIIEK